MQLPGATDDLSAATYCLYNEDHTIGNSLRYILMKKLVVVYSIICVLDNNDNMYSPQVEFCGYSIPHPSEPKVNLRIQMYDNLSSLEALFKGLEDLESLFDSIQNAYNKNLSKGTYKEYENDQINLSYIKNKFNL